MTVAELQTFVENITENKINATFFYDLLTVARDILAEERDWAILEALNESLSASLSDTYTTAKSLAGITDFGRPLSLYVGSDKISYHEVPFIHRERWKDYSRRFYIDYLNSNLYITKVAEAGTIHLWYKPFFGTIGANTTITFPPARFHRLLGFYTAGVHQGGVDWDTIAGVMSRQNFSIASELRRTMIEWDGNIQASRMMYSSGDADLSVHPGDPNRLDTNM